MRHLIPFELIDPEGEGIYLNPDRFGVLMHASWLFFGTWLRWREVESKTVWMREAEDDMWYTADIGKHPYGWKLNLWWKKFIPFAYCTPKEGSM